MNFSLYDKGSFLRALCFGGLTLLVIFATLLYLMVNEEEKYQARVENQLPLRWITQYMLAQQRKTKKWPTTLAGFPAYIHTQITDKDERLDVMHIYRSQFLRFETIETRTNLYNYRIYMKDGTFDCNAVVDPRRDRSSCSQVNER